MAIKWNISGKAMKMRGLMDQISSEYDGGIEMGTEHLGDVKAIRAQLGEMQDDLVAAANVMGNGGGNGGSDSQPTPPIVQMQPPVIPQPEPPQNAPAATPAPLSTGS